MSLCCVFEQHYPLPSTGSTKEDSSNMTEKNVDCDVKNQDKQKLHICFSAPTLKLNLKFSFIFLRFAQLTWAIDIC